MPEAAIRTVTGMVSLRPRRRWVVRVGLAVAAACLVMFAIPAWMWWNTGPVDTVGTLGFSNPLHIPPLAESREEGGRRVFDLRVEAGRTQFLEGEATETWGLNGTYLSPTLRAERGEAVVVNVTNGVDETTTLHWHGMKLPARADGGPHQLIEPGTTWSPTWTIDQPAATLWFHPHLHGATGEHVYRGVAGLFIVDDPHADDLGLPDEYGVDDIPVIVQDRAFDGDNQFIERRPFLAGVGILGDQILVNGTHDPHLDVTTDRVRLRVLNASNARIYDLQFDDDRSFELIGTDAGLLPAPVELDRLLVSPGERVEIVVAVTPGERVVLQSIRPDLGTNVFSGGRANGSQDAFDLLQLRAADRLETIGTVPATLVPFDPPTPEESARTRTLALGNDRINGRQMDMRRVDEVVTVDTTEIWEITNRHGSPHSFHPHLIHFAVLDVDGRPPPPHLTGWKDTVYVPPGSTVRVIARFEDHADPEVPYMFHCHVLQHEDDGMMGQFLVVEPGQEPARRIDHVDHGDHGH